MEKFSSTLKIPLGFFHLWIKFTFEKTFFGLSHLQTHLQTTLRLFSNLNSLFLTYFRRHFQSETYKACSDTYFYNKKSINVYRFLIHTAVFCKKEDKLDLRQFCFVFPSKQTTFLHISEVSFDRKCIKIVDIHIFIIKNWKMIMVLLLNRTIFEKTESSWAFESIFK